MSKKIVIDKEKIESLIKEYKGSSNEFIKGRISMLKGILAHSTEIDTDQSIEERAKSIFFKHNKEHIAMNSSINSSASDCIEAMKELATEQDLISKAREKEKVYFFIDEEGSEILSNECKPKGQCGDSEWWFDEESKMFRRYYTYYDELEGTQIVHEEHLAKLKN